ncbi:hypothetical protein ACN9MN_17460 [Chryseobacterium sp. S-02]
MNIKIITFTHKIDGNPSPDCSNCLSSFSFIQVAAASPPQPE